MLHSAYLQTLSTEVTREPVIGNVSARAPRGFATRSRVPRGSLCSPS